MAKVVIKAKVKGEREVEVPMYANTLSDFLILTEEVAEKISPKFLGYDEEIEVGGGGKVKGSVCLVTLRIRDPKTGEERQAEVEAVVLKGEKYCVIGHETLGKFRIKINPTTGEYEFI